MSPIHECWTLSTGHPLQLLGVGSAVPSSQGRAPRPRLEKLPLFQPGDQDRREAATAGLRLWEALLDYSSRTTPAPDAGVTGPILPAGKPRLRDVLGSSPRVLSCLQSRMGTPGFLTPGPALLPW